MIMTQAEREKLEFSLRTNFAARTLAYNVSIGNGNSWLLPPGLELRSGSFPVEALLMLQERWLVKCAAVKWPLTRMGDFNSYSMINLLRRHTAREQLEICSILEKVYGFYA